MPTIAVVEAPTDADREAVRAPLKAYNEAKVGSYAHENVAVMLRDDAGDAVGGLWGRSAFDWLYIDLLVVPDDLRGRGLGTALMREAEAVARDRGCQGVWLNTLAFQARGFYEKLGFTLFGTIDDHPAGGALYFLSKRL